jgi:hypothetical protein
MASSINASTSGAGGVITTADNSGILNLQSAGTTVATVQSSGFSLPTGATINAANTFGFENRIINGNMVIDQRNAGALVNPAVNGAYYLDRWTVASTSASKFSIGQNAGSVTLPAGFIKYLGITSLAATSLSATDQYFLQQNIEGLNCTDLGWGTANAKTVTLSFQVYSSLTGTFGGALLNSAQNRSYPFTYSIPVANTWTTISVTIAGDTSGTWLTTNGTGIRVTFGLGVGSTYSGTAGAWAGSLYYSATGATSVVGTNGATWYITGVQLEVGSQATSFDFRDYGRELILCQRYYEVQGFATGATTVSGVNYGIGAGNIASYGSFPFAVVKRASPTVTVSGTWSYANVSGVVTLSGSGPSSYSVFIANGGAAGGFSATTTTTSGITAAIEL